jgi:hypothetical protein
MSLNQTRSSLTLSLPHARPSQKHPEPRAASSWQLVFLQEHSLEIWSLLLVFSVNVQERVDVKLEESIQGVNTLQ